MSNLLNFIFPARYETRRMLNNYIRAQYGPFLKKNPTHDFEGFYEQIVAIARTFINSTTRALDIGTGTGRLVFEYAHLSAGSVCGTETSTSFIHFCEQFQQNKTKEIIYPLPETAVTFLNDDVCSSKLPSASFNFISCLNVIDRVPDPTATISNLARLLVPGGVALIADPYDWELSPAPKTLQVANIKDLLSEDLWNIEDEHHFLYRIPTGKNMYRDYDCHLVIARKK